MNHRLFRDRRIVTTAEGIDDRTTEDLEIGFLQIGCSLTFQISGILIGTITTGKELTDINILGILCHGTLALTRRHKLVRYADIGIPLIGNTILLSLREFYRLLGYRRVRIRLFADDTRYIVTSIDIVDEHIPGGMLTIEMYKRTTIDIGHTGAAEDLVQVAGIKGHRGIASDIALIATAIDITANLDLCAGLQTKEH